MRIARLTLRHAGKFNAMSCAMWQQLRQLCEELQAQTRAANPLRCVLIEGADGHFCAGADIAEFPSFRFDAQSLRHFHEEVVWPALAAVLALDCPVIATIDGHCMGAGLEVACCCDIRIATTASRYGAPIAKLGFPMAPHETALLTRVLGETCTRSILLEAAIYPAAEMLQRGFITRSVADAAALRAECQRTIEHICSLGPACARLNKQTLRTLQGVATHAVSANLTDVPDPYAYASSAEHREGITAFLEKRPPRF
ncbi:MAG: enoyl-CoA hydratase/isomerase family protein [Brachymonas sp.]|nr:enoyl-CoA hydratase/isomerase family protein [Brachymonas sp.]